MSEKRNYWYAVVSDVDSKILFEFMYSRKIG